VHEEVTPVSDEAFVARVCVPVVNWVEVIVAFQPTPVPRVSCTANAAVYVGVESPLSKLAEKLGTALVVRLSVLPLTVPVTTAEAAFATVGAVPTSARALRQEIRNRWHRMASYIDRPSAHLEIQREIALATRRQAGATAARPSFSPTKPT
jgi:hypothetical protein